MFANETNKKSLHFNNSRKYKLRPDLFQNMVIKDDVGKKNSTDRDKHSGTFFWNMFSNLSKCPYDDTFKTPLTVSRANIGKYRESQISSKNSHFG